MIEGHSLPVWLPGCATAGAGRREAVLRGSQPTSLASRLCNFCVCFCQAYLDRVTAYQFGFQAVQRCRAPFRPASAQSSQPTSLASRLCNPGGACTRSAERRVTAYQFGFQAVQPSAPQGKEVPRRSHSLPVWLPGCATLLAVGATPADICHSLPVWLPGCATAAAVQFLSLENGSQPTSLASRLCNPLRRETGAARDAVTAYQFGFQAVQHAYHAIVLKSHNLSQPTSLASRLCNPPSGGVP